MNLTKNQKKELKKIRTETYNTEHSIVEGDEWEQLKNDARKKGIDDARKRKKERKGIISRIFAKKKDVKQEPIPEQNVKKMSASLERIWAYDKNKEVYK